MNTKNTIKSELLTVFDLAGIAPDQAAQELFFDQIASILAYVEDLATIDIDASESTTHAVSIDCPLNTDKPGLGSNRTEVMREAPQAADGCFATPKIVPGH